MLRFSELTGRDPAADALLARHHALMRSQSPAESCHVLTAAELHAQGACILVGRDSDGTIKAIGAFVGVQGNGLPAGAAELKSMHCHADLRGQGVGAALLNALMTAAREAGVTSLWLETGSAPTFLPARRLYEGQGFVPCQPFGAYTEDPLSVFMTRTL